MKIIERGHVALGRNNAPRRQLSTITHIAVHHSATQSGNTSIFETHWQYLGWKVGGYHRVILRNGDVEANYLPEVITNGIRGHNDYTFHVCLVGDGQFTAAQDASLLIVLRDVMAVLGIPPANVMGHREFPGTATACPGRQTEPIRRKLRQLLEQAPPPAGSSSHTVRQGDTLFAIARLHGTTPAEIQRLNNLGTSTLIRPGQVLRLPQAAAPSPFKTWDQVRIKPGATHWATGQAIPSWARSQTFTIQQIRTQGSQALLAGILSWIHTKDLIPA